MIYEISDFLFATINSQGDVELSESRDMMPPTITVVYEDMEVLAEWLDENVIAATKNELS